MPGTGDRKLDEAWEPSGLEPQDLAQVNSLLKQEIAHRRRAEEANAKFAAIVESSSDAIIGQKLAGTIVTWNKGAEQIFGYTSEEACGRSVSILAPPDLFPSPVRPVSLPCSRVHSAAGTEP